MSDVQIEVIPTASNEVVATGGDTYDVIVTQDTYDVVVTQGIPSNVPRFYVASTPPSNPPLGTIYIPAP